MSHALFSGGFLPQAGDYFLAHGLGERVVHADLGAEAVIPLLSWDDLIIEAIDRLHSPIRAAADDLIRLVHEPVQANPYLLWGETHGFDAHWDDHDTMIVRVMGTKSWTVHGPGRTHPMRLDADSDHTCPNATVWEGTLEAGHALHVPRGWWHIVRGTGDVSLHLTFGFTRTTGIDWATWLVERRRTLDLFRRDLPRFADREHSADHYRQLLHQLTDTAAMQDPAKLLAPAGPALRPTPTIQPAVAGELRSACQHGHRTTGHRDRPCGDYDLGRSDADHGRQALHVQSRSLPRAGSADSRPRADRGGSRPPWRISAAAAA